MTMKTCSSSRADVIDMTTLGWDRRASALASARAASRPRARHRCTTSRRRRDRDRDRTPNITTPIHRRPGVRGRESASQTPRGSDAAETAPPRCEHGPGRRPIGSGGAPAPSARSMRSSDAAALGVDCSASTVSARAGRYRMDRPGTPRRTISFRALSCNLGPAGVTSSARATLPVRHGRL